VTQALWLAVIGENPSHFEGDLARPVESVSWDDCQAFLGRLNAQVAGLGARLPTEAEWERACRGGTGGATWVGDLSGTYVAPELNAIAWYHGNSGGATHPVGRKAANPYGLHDMVGNVYEWCADAGELRPYPAEAVTDPLTAGQDSFRVHRGGSWFSDAGRLRAAFRDAFGRQYRYGFLGVRLAGG
jgi:formylglycine-generating enzyme required for sulfatase activity